MTVVVELRIAIGDLTVVVIGGSGALKRLLNTLPTSLYTTCYEVVEAF